SSQGRARRERMESGLEESTPVVRGDPVQRAHQVLEAVRHHFRRAARATVELLAEVVQRMLATGELADRDVRLEPEKQALVVEVRPAPPRSPFGRSVVEQLSLDRGIEERPPGTARAVVELSRRQREGVPRLLGRADTA